MGAAAKAALARLRVIAGLFAFGLLVVRAALDASADQPLLRTSYFGLPS